MSAAIAVPFVSVGMACIFISASFYVEESQETVRHHERANPREDVEVSGQEKGGRVDSVRLEPIGSGGADRTPAYTSLLKRGHISDDE
ncbi:MAG: hypothetical protein ACSHYB_07340 [Roseibacillus sp.]